MEQAVDAAEVDERTVLGDVLDGAGDDHALFEGLAASCAFSSSRSFSRSTRRDEHDVAALLVELDDLELVGLADQLVEVADGPQVDLRAGQERLHAAADGDARGRPSRAG